MSFCCIKRNRILKNILTYQFRNRCSRNSVHRTLLSAAYQCSNVWNERLKQPLFKGIDLDDFFMEMDKKFIAKKRVSALDIDLFANSIDSDDRFEELEHILYLFRRTRSTVRTMCSTHHAVTRLMTRYGRDEALLRILSDRIKYGIFPDDYALNLAMDSLIEKKNYKDASRIASLWMLQEDLSNPVSRILALYSCHMHLNEDNAQSWHDGTPVVQNADDEEEELVRVPYLRNPYFDDHFDLTLREHLLGKTLYYVGKLMNDVVGRSYAAIGLALYEKWSELDSLLNEYQKNKETISNEAESRIRSLLTSKEINESTEDSSQENENKQELRDEKSTDTSKNSVIKNLSSMKGQGLIVDSKLHDLVMAKIKDLAKLEVKDITDMKQLFQEWELARNAELKRELNLVSIREEQETLDAKKKELADREQFLYFFENEDKYLMEVDEIDKEKKEEMLKTVHKEEEYIVPELPRTKPVNMSKRR